MPAGYLYALFREMSVQILCPFSIRLLVFLLLSCRNSLYILKINLYQIYGLQTFSPVL